VELLNKMSFKLIKKSKKSQARLGELKTAHGVLATPFFMPIATKAAVKNLTVDEIKQLKSPIILSNTYHLYLTPGTETMKKIGGLHKFMNWPGAILTDSGGFQVFSLSKLRKILKAGVEFRSHLDGSKHFLTPRKVLEIQKIIGSDIAMILDVCPSSKAEYDEVKQAVEITTKWAKEAKRVIGLKSFAQSKQLRFAIVQGGIFKELRLRSLKELIELEFDGYAIGGLAVGETNQEMYQVLDYLTPLMPKNKPCYLMGVGTPENIIEAVRRGVDMFDCVIPTREARHGRLYVLQTKKSTTKKSKDFSVDYEKINILNAQFKNDFTPINQTNLKKYSRAYLHHLFKTGEPLGMRLATLNNLDFYLGLMNSIRKAIGNNSF
jgi:queuine tRNA-ribosyltransferase